MANQVDPVVSEKFAERALWSLRHWCADVSMNWATALRTDAVMPLVSDQEASLFDSLGSHDRYSAHLIYADWLDERGMGTASD